jgi:hypothetical protein
MERRRKMIRKSANNRNGEGNIASTMVGMYVLSAQ